MSPLESEICEKISEGTNMEKISNYSPHSLCERDSRAPPSGYLAELRDGRCSRNSFDMIKSK